MLKVLYIYESSSFSFIFFDGDKEPMIFNAPIRTLPKSTAPAETSASLQQNVFISSVFANTLYSFLVSFLSYLTCFFVGIIGVG